MIRPVNSKFTALYRNLYMICNNLHSASRWRPVERRGIGDLRDDVESFRWKFMKDKVICRSAIGVQKVGFSKVC